ncbi:MAG: UvrD-helicase domain-containing protein [Synergistales bacterium]|nr:UvrD-helicase domain-containing protein [Synergistales bacterium]
MATAAEIFQRYLEEKARLEPEQVKAVMGDGPLVVVSAGAGTGKTLTLSWRFLRLVVVDGVPLERILTITFTEKAALEMRERIRGLLGEVRDGIPAFSEGAGDALSRLDEAYISTIHAFSMRILRESGLSVNVDPGIRLITPPEENSFWQRLERSIDREEMGPLAGTLTGKWRERAREVFSSRRTCDLVDAFGAGGIVGAASSAISLFESKNLDPEALWEWSEDLPERDGELSRRLRKEFAPLWRRAWVDWMEGILPGAGGLKRFLADKTQFSARAAAFMETWDEEPGDEDLPRFVMDLLGESLLGKLSGGKCKEDVNGLALTVTGQGLKEYRDDRKAWSAAARWITGDRPPQETEMRALLLKVIALSWELFRAAKSASGTLSFDDMISRALQVVTAESSLPGRFLHVIVDEFQDTNALQDDLLSALVPEGGGSLFLVGDLQQSIYRFRHAEPAIFLKRVMEAFQSDPDSLVNLDVTFRSRQAVMDAVNSLFGRVWREGVTKALESGFSRLAPPESRDWWPKRQETTVKPFEIVIPAGEAPPAKPRVSEIRLSAMRLLADRIVEAVDSGATVWDTDGEGSFAPRPARFRDFAVLVPSRTFYDQIEQVFIDERGIPTYFEGNRNYFGRGEVRDAVRLLEALADPGDPLAMASFLASPLSGLAPGVSARLIARSRSDGSNLPSLLAQEHPLEASRFERLRREGLAAGPSRPLATLLEDDSALLSCEGWKRPRVAANLRRAIDLAREYEAGLGMSLGGCADYLRDMTRRGIETREADTLGEDDDMVRVMTVHAAKGLEFPVVAVTGLELAPRTRKQGVRLVVSPHLGIAATALPEGWVEVGEREVLAGAIHDLFENRETWEENQRLLYVACTRARDSLILCGASPRTEEGELRSKRHSWLETVLDWAGSDGSGPPEPEPPTEGAARRGKAAPATKGERVDLPPEEGGTLERISATAYALLKFCPFAFRMRHRQGLDISWEMPSDDVGGADLGSLAHWLLRRWDLRPETLSLYDPLRDGAGLGELLPADLRPVWADPAKRVPLMGWLERFASSPLAERIRNGEDTRKEVPFRVRLDNGALMVGVIDVIWREGEKTCIRDYKIGRIENAPRELYRSQLLFYALAARKHFGGSPLELALLSLKENREIPVGKDPFSWEDLEEDVASATRQGAAGPFEPSRKMCPLCPWKGECVLGREWTKGAL